MKKCEILDENKFLFFGQNSIFFFNPWNFTTLKEFLKDWYNLFQNFLIKFNSYFFYLALKMFKLKCFIHYIQIYNKNK